MNCPRSRSVLGTVPTKQPVLATAAAAVIQLEHCWLNDRHHAYMYITPHSTQFRKLPIICHIHRLLGTSSYEHEPTGSTGQP